MDKLLYYTSENKSVINYKDSEVVFGVCILYTLLFKYVFRRHTKVEKFRKLHIFVSRLAFKSLYNLKFLV